MRTFEMIEALDSVTGATLAVRVECIVQRPKALVLISHGLVEHCYRYRRFAAYLAAHGYAVFAHDHRGHGATTAPDAALGRFARRDGALLLVDDLLQVLDCAESRYPDCPALLFGHSMGGMIAASAAETMPQRFKGLAIWNSNLDPGLAGMVGTALLKLERFFKGSDVPSLLAPRFTFEAWASAIADARTPFDWLSRDAREVQAYIDDPLCGFPASVSMWLDVLRLAGDTGRKDRLARLPTSLPVHLVGGDADPSTSGGRAMGWLAQRMRSLGMRDITLTVYPRMRHETLHEIGSEDALADFVAWADRVVARF